MIVSFTKCPKVGCLTMIVPSVHPRALKVRIDGSDAVLQLVCQKCGTTFEVKENDLVLDSVSEEALRMYYPDLQDVEERLIQVDKR